MNKLVFSVSGDPAVKRVCFLGLRNSGNLYGAVSL